MHAGFAALIRQAIAAAASVTTKRILRLLKEFIILRLASYRRQPSAYTRAFHTATLAPPT